MISEHDISHDFTKYTLIGPRKKRCVMKKFIKVLIPMVLVGIILASCLVETTEPLPTTSIEAQETDLSGQYETLQAIITEQAATLESLNTAESPVPTEEVVTPEATAEPLYAGEFIVIDSEGLVFKLPVEVAESATVSTVFPDDPVEGWLDFVLPERRVINFSGYSIQNHFHTPVIYVYPLQKLKDGGLYGESMAANLQELLDDSSIDLQMAADLPFLPPFNAAQVFHVLEERLISEHNSGIRYLTLYSQAIVGVDNYNIFYTYQGISADKSYYIAAILPINSTLLSYEELTLAEMETLSQDFTNYITIMTELIRADNGDSLIPALEALDAMMMSLETLN